MKHLTSDEMIDFVSMNNLDEESIKLASKVNLHIGECEKCLQKLQAFQLVYDEMIKIGSGLDYRKAIYSMTNEIQSRTKGGRTEGLEK